MYLAFNRMELDMPEKPNAVALVKIIVQATNDDPLFPDIFLRVHIRAARQECRWGRDKPGFDLALNLGEVFLLRGERFPAERRGCQAGRHLAATVVKCSLDDVGGALKPLFSHLTGSQTGDLTTISRPGMLKSVPFAPKETLLWLL